MFGRKSTVLLLLILAQAQWQDFTWQAGKRISDFGGCGNFYSGYVDGSDLVGLVQLCPDSPITFYQGINTDAPNKFSIPQSELKVGYMTDLDLDGLQDIVTVSKSGQFVVVTKRSRDDLNRWNAQSVYGVQGEIVDACAGEHHYEILVAVKSPEGEFSIVKLSLTDFGTMVPDVVDYNFQNTGIKQVLGAYDVEFDGIVDVVYLSAKNRLDYLTRSGDVFEKKAWISTALNVDRVSNWYFTIVGSSPSLLLPTNDGLYQFYYDQVWDKELAFEGKIDGFSMDSHGNGLLSSNGKLYELKFEEFGLTSVQVLISDNVTHVVGFSITPTQELVLYDSNTDALYYAGETDAEIKTGVVVDVDSEDDKENNEQQEKQKENQQNTQNEEKETEVFYMGEDMCFFAVVLVLLILLLILLCVLIRSTEQKIYSSGPVTTRG